MPLLRFTILIIIFGVVASQNHDVNSQTSYKRMTRQGSVAAADPIPPDPSTRSVEDSSSNVASKPIFNKGLQKNLPTATSTSNPLNVTLNKPYPKNCREVRESGNNASGIYMLEPEHASKPFEAICDLEVRGGNWTVIQKRYDGSQDFYLGWEDYKNGFGSLTGEFWLGLENIHLLTGYKESELLIELENFESHKVSAFYSNFSIGSESERYSLNNLGTYSVDAGDSLTDDLGLQFSTKDMGETSCAIKEVGAWWYSTTYGCSHSRLNGRYAVQGPKFNTYDGLYWSHFKSEVNNFKHTRMLVRPKV